VAAPRKGRDDFGGVGGGRRRGGSEENIGSKKEAIKHRGAQHDERPARGVRVDCGVTVEERLIRAGVYSG